MATNKFKFTPFQEAWLKALETGKYKQGKRRLATRNKEKKTVGYCCLGVACEVYRNLFPGKLKKKYKTVKYPGYDDDNRVIYGDNEEQLYLPQELVSELGLFDHKGTPKQCSLYQDLSRLNDNGKTHKEIAKIVRANPEKYFRQ